MKSGFMKIPKVVILVVVLVLVLIFVRINTIYKARVAELSVLKAENDSLRIVSDWMMVNLDELEGGS